MLKVYNKPAIINHMDVSFETAVSGHTYHYNGDFSEDGQLISSIHTDSRADWLAWLKKWFGI